MKRVLTALVALPILLYATWSSQPYLFFGIAILAIVAALFEFFHIAARAGAPPFRQVGLAAAAGFIGSAVVRHLEWDIAVFGILGVGIVISMLTRVDDKQRVLISAGATCLGVVYVAYLGSFLIAVRAIEDSGLAAKLLTLYFAIIMLSDTAAYYTGRALGKHKLAPRVSPAKTIEGSIGGVVGSVGGALASKYIFFPELPLWHAVVLGAGLGVLGQIGDLCESLLKRGSDVKDAASILPGHGGFLDRLDSMLLTAPVLYLYAVWMGALGAP